MKTKILSLFALTSLLFVSCSSDEDNSNDSSPKPVQFTTKVEVQGITTRAPYVTIWNAGDAIGIYMVEHSTFNILEGAENKKYTTTKDGIFNGIGNQVIYYPVDTTKKVDFIAYYPHVTPLSNMTYPINIGIQSNQSAIDFMYADPVTNKDKSTTSVSLNFRHKLAKIVLNIEKGAGIDSLTNLSVKIKNVVTVGSVDLRTGTLSQNTSKADVIPYLASFSRENATCEAILLPIQAFTTDNKIEFTLDGNTYVWNMSNLTVGDITSLNAGTKYTYTITISKTGLSGLSATITDWNYQRGSGVAL